MKQIIKLEREERPNGEIWYNLFKGCVCESIFKEIGDDAMTYPDGRSVALADAEDAYDTLVALHKKGPATTILKEIEV